MRENMKEFTGGIVKTLLFIGLVMFFCPAVVFLGLFAASKLGLTTSRVQVPLSHVAIDGEEIPIPLQGKVTEGKGWVLRNSKGQYTLTLDGLKAGSLERKTPALEIQGDLTLVLKKGTESELLSADAALKKGAGTLTIRGEGSLRLQGGTALEGEWKEETLNQDEPSALRIEGGKLVFTGEETALYEDTVELAGGEIQIQCLNGKGTGIRAHTLDDRHFSGSLEMEESEE